VATNFAALRKRVHVLAELAGKEEFTEADEAQTTAQAVELVGLALVGVYEELTLIREALQGSAQ